MHFLPQYPLLLNEFALFGFILLLGLIGGELMQRSRFIPRISGYILVGFLAGQGGFNIINPASFTSLHIFIDISLGIILFDLGRHLDFKWLYHDKGLLPMAIAESGFTLLLTFIILRMLGLPWLPAALIGTIAMTSSPSVIMMVAHDVSAEGPVTRRTLTLTSLNNLVALIIFGVLLPFTQNTDSISDMYSHSLYRVLGSILLSLIIFTIVKYLARFIGKHKENQFVLLVGSIILTTALAQNLNFSILLSLLVLGVLARNIDFKHDIMEVDFGWFARLFLIILFVITGSYLQVHGLWKVTGAVLAFIIARYLAKTAGIWLFAKQSRLTAKQAWALSLALTPMAGVAIGMSNILVGFNPDLGR